MFTGGLPSFELFVEQLKTIWIVLHRPIVQLQLLFIVLLVVASSGISVVLERYVDRLPHRGLWERLHFASYLIFSFITLIVGYLMIAILDWFGQATGLIEDAMIIFWFVLGYQLLVALLSQRLGATSTRAYRRRILLPLLFILISTRLLNAFVGGIAVLSQFEILKAFGISFRLGTLVLALVVLYVFITLAWLVQDVLYRVLLPRSMANPGVVNSIVTIGRYSIIGFGILFAFRILGLDLSSFALIGGGLSIGIGFGLQQLVSNFISGIVLLFEQSLRPGDLIKLNEEIGIVERLNIRSTVVRTYDNVEIIVPNEKFLTSQLTTYTKTDRLVRLSVPVGVGYDSEPREIERHLLSAAEGHADILKQPKPIVMFMGFGESSLDFSLNVWIDEAVNMPRVRSDLHYAIWDVLKAHNIEIPFPQREVTVKRES